MKDETYSAQKIVAIKKDSKDEIEAYKLSNGEILSKEEAVEFAKNGKIQDVIISKSKTGEEYLKSIPDGKESNNLSNLEQF
ncbi:DUF3892 domain-containing protein [Clostridium fallax]|uniref:DUF3892 domain-containing protein n=1 Tax=Clostridium fallax TaxID=1533 RepID=A0A1M4WTG8_9CLOT|nr:DUF3892 domain-containing protein [Clostridium fallax]SHE84500.1 Protein of unknown function [Clostridium fallax]SQB07397.1 Uncharacterised protein [Clostridium fallax]